MVNAELLKSKDGEICLLACLLKDPKLIPVYLDRIDSSLFYWELNKNIYSCLVQMYDQGIDIDTITVVEYYKKTFGKDEISYFITINESIASTAIIDQYLNICVEKKQYRQIKDYCTSAIHQIGQGEPPEDILHNLGADISTIQNNHKDQTLPEQIHELNKMIDARRLGDNSTYLRTGFNGIDRLMPTGINDTDLFIIAGRPGMGKTTLGIQMALNMIKQKRAVMFYSLEMSFSQILSKCIVIEVGINYTNYVTGRMTPTEFEKYSEVLSYFPQLSLKVIDKVGSLNEIKAKTVNYKQQGLCDVLFIDYVQLLPYKGQNANDSISLITRQLKNLSMKINVPIILLSQLNRNNEKDKCKPTLASLRDGGSLEQDSSKVLFIHRPDLKDENSQDKLILEKNRDGRCGEINVIFDREIVKFKEN